MEPTKQAFNEKLHWYKDAIIYELHIKAFCDSNGDGIGDFGGLMQKLDYLQELGVNAIWLLPFYPSPLRDDGYDIADYYNINQSYGNITQLKTLLHEAHQRNLKIITELVINHTSDQHPWFQRARSAPKGSPERDYYVWTDDPSQYKDVRIIFQDFEASNWTWDPLAEQYYWHRFFHHQPDLNYDNPLVQQEVFNMIDFWCNMGVDGFRLDAVPYLYEREGTNGENLPETHAFLKRLRAHVDAKFPGTVLLAEANMWPEDSASYFGDGDECHMNYHFPVMPRMFMALQMEDRYPITDIFDQTPAIPPTCQWAIFLRNHDELTLEMVTDEERDYMYKVYAKDPKARINLGIRHRLAPLMENNREKIELLNTLLFALPGTPVIYYGDEIGMGDNYYLGDRDGVRTPMQWSPDRNAGFSHANPHQLYLPLILDPEYHYESVNVEMQRRNTSSLFWFMKRMINMRKKHKAFGRGDLTFLNVDNPKVLAFLRKYEDETLLIVVNLSKFAQVAEVPLEGYKGFALIELMSRNKFPAIGKAETYFFTLAPHTCLWFSLEKAHPDFDEKKSIPLIQINEFKDIVNKDYQAELENDILPAYLKQSRWFTGRARAIHNVEIIQQGNVPSSPEASLLLVEVTYESGLPELYRLIVTFVQNAVAKKLTDSFPHSVIAHMHVKGQEGILCDALYVTTFQQWLFKNLLQNQTMVFKENIQIKFYNNGALSTYVAQHDDIKPKIFEGNRYQIAITYDNSFFLTIYRRVDYYINPDAEITHFLSEYAKFKYVPPFLGAIEWMTDKGTITTGMLQVMIENHGNGYSYMQERVYNYIERILAMKQDSLPSFESKGNLADPVPFEQLSPELKDLLGSRAAEQARLIGMRTGEMHLALASGTHLKDFRPEEFSLHYQRSLYSAMVSLVREVFQNLKRNISRLPGDLQPEAEELLKHRDEVLKVFKKIYDKKLDVLKIRIHGFYNLSQILFTGKDIAIKGYGGDPLRPYSERRLKRSPLIDVATMLRSFHNVVFEGFHANHHILKDNMPKYVPFLRLWAHYMGGFFMKAYLDTVKGSKFVPPDNADFRVMLQTYLLEKSLLELNHSLNDGLHSIIMPMRTIRMIIK
ncbi:maltose alpha-D-glucosyltransferase [Niastella koreensis]|uniref:maltose alpha-D-glucosyltransferase n=2 Tax=Niastella koreensis TaxID=354356 RepID=G8TAD9_NIAKG|nr:maltose alpha-D-glucosyltransferase [Niastella koreensis]AEV97086.1 trehalose synthase [Niastella koreensis GR20-10]OQP39225.1 maltose alpha-D-glucosyltransferase [Niastella koreensis]